MIFAASQSNATCLAGLASPKGAMIVAVVYGFSQGISNFLWSFRWNKHTSVSDETSAKIQEWGGVTASIENFALGVLVPILIWESGN